MPTYPVSVSVWLVEGSPFLPAHDVLGESLQSPVESTSRVSLSSLHPVAGPLMMTAASVLSPQPVVSEMQAARLSNRPLPVYPRFFSSQNC